MVPLFTYSLITCARIDLNLAKAVWSKEKERKEQHCESQKTSLLFYFHLHSELILCETTSFIWKWKESSL